MHVPCRAARARHGVHFVDEQDRPAGGSSDLAYQRLDALLGLAHERREQLGAVHFPDPASLAGLALQNAGDDARERGLSNARRAVQQDPRPLRPHAVDRRDIGMRHGIGDPPQRAVPDIVTARERFRRQGSSRPRSPRTAYSHPRPPAPSRSQLSRSRRTLLRRRCSRESGSPRYATTSSRSWWRTMAPVRANQRSATAHSPGRGHDVVALADHRIRLGGEIDTVARAQLRKQRVVRRLEQCLASAGTMRASTRRPRSAVRRGTPPSRTGAR